MKRKKGQQTSDYYASLTEKLFDIGNNKYTGDSDGTDNNQQPQEETTSAVEVIEGEFTKEAQEEVIEEVIDVIEDVAFVDVIPAYQRLLPAGSEPEPETTKPHIKNPFKRAPGRNKEKKEVRGFRFSNRVSLKRVDTPEPSEIKGFERTKFRNSAYNCYFKQMMYLQDEVTDDMRQICFRGWDNCKLCVGDFAYWQHDAWADKTPGSCTYPCLIVGVRTEGIDIFTDEGLTYTTPASRLFNQQRLT